MQDILTEEEAKKRWCPMLFSKVKGNQSDELSDFGKCVASECMAWRLAHKPAASGEETGFCGAFGIPRHT